jgi:hypothetical protein
MDAKVSKMDAFDEQEFTIERLNKSPENVRGEWELIKEQANKSTLWMLCFLASAALNIILILFMSANAK